MQSRENQWCEIDLSAEQCQRVSEDLSQVFRKLSGCRIRETCKNSHYVIKQLTAIYSST